MSNYHSTPLFDLAAEDFEEQRIFINPCLWFEDRDGYRVVFCRHEPIYRFAIEDQLLLRLVVVELRLSGLATQVELARAFGHDVRQLRRWERRYQKDGIDGLINQKSPGRQCKIGKAQDDFIRKWYNDGLSPKQIAKRLGVGLSTIYRSFKRLGLQLPKTPQPQIDFGEELELVSGDDEQPLAAEEVKEEKVELDVEVEKEEEEEVSGVEIAASAETSPRNDSTTTESQGPLSGGALTIDSDPTDRSGDRMLAQQGMIEDAVPLFANVQSLPRGGSLLAIPLLVHRGYLSVFLQVYRSLKPAFYGLRSMVLVLFLCLQLRLKRVENLKEYNQTELGRIIGLDRMPEVKTVRRKLSQMAAQNKADELQKELARLRISEQSDRIAFLYFDGHVREYHGKHPLSKTKKSSSPVARKAETDTWIHDAHGEPLLVVHSPMNEGLTKVLEPILEDVKDLVPCGCRVTIVFDRGGFSAKLFDRLIEAGFDVITYRKGKKRKLPKSYFTEHHLEAGGKHYTYKIFERQRSKVGRLRPKGSKGRQYLWLRQITVLRANGRQTEILTNRTDLEAGWIAFRMFERWRQENFFKYMIAEYALDALVEYGVEDVSEEYDRVNPRWTRTHKQLDKARLEVRRLQEELGAAASENEESRRPTMRGFRIANSKLFALLSVAKEKVQQLMSKLKQIPKRIGVSGLKIHKQEKKKIVDACKMVAYDVETELYGMLYQYYSRSEDEGRTFLHAVFQSSADLEVTETELRVKISPLSSPHRTRALAALCEELNALKVKYPDTNLLLILSVKPHRPDIS